MEDQRIKEILLDRNEDFRRLFLEHRKYEEELNILAQRPEKSPEDEVTEHNLKKQKLKIKDEMQKHIVEFKKKLSEYG